MMLATIFIVISIDKLLLSNNIYSYDTSHLWEFSLFASNPAEYLHQILTTSPLTFNNLYAIFQEIAFLDKISSPIHFITIIYSITLWLYLNHLIKHHYPINFFRIITYFLLLLNPFSLSLIIMSPLETLNAILFAGIIYGIEEINLGIEGRGVLVTAVSLVLLFLNGMHGIAITTCIFFMLPLFLRNSVFKINSRSGYIVTFFPLLASLLGVVYLSYIFDLKIDNFLFKVEKEKHSYNSLWNWLFLSPIFLMPFTKIKQENIKIRLSKTKSFFIPFLANLFFLVFEIKHNQSTFLGFAMLSFCFENIQKKSVGIRHFFVVLLLSASTLIHLHKDYLINPFSLTDWAKLHNPLSLTKEEAQVANYVQSISQFEISYLTENYNKIRISSSYQNLHSHKFTQKFVEQIEKGKMDSTFVVIENPFLDINFNFFTQKQIEYFETGIPNYSLLFQTKNWKIFKKNN